MRTINSLSMSSLAVLLLAVLAVFLSNLHGGSAKRTLAVISMVITDSSASVVL